MIDALIAGTLHGKPASKTTKAGKPYTRSQGPHPRR